MDAQLMLEHLPAIVWTVDRDLRITSILGAGLARFNLFPERIVDRTIFDFLPTQDPEYPPLAAHFKALAGASVAMDFSWPSWHFQVHLDPLRDEQGNINGCIGVALDISQQKQTEEAGRKPANNELRKLREELELRIWERTAVLAQTNETLRREIEDRYEMEKALRESEERLRLVLETAHDGFISLDGTGKVIVWNAQAEAMFGWSRQEVLGRPIVDLIIPGPYQKNHLEGLKRFLLSGEGPFLNRRLELSARNRAGQEFPVELTVRANRTSQGWTFNAFIQDLRPRKETEEKLRQAERLAAIGQMVAGLAHESRNALQQIQACLEILRVKGGPQLDPLIEDIQKAQDHLHRLFGEVRTYAAHRRLRLEPVDLGAILDQIWNQLIALEKNREFHLESNTAGLELVCRAEGQALGQVFRNILENSLFACGKEVRIQVNWSEGDWKGNPALQIRIRDNGPGLTPEARARIFEPFFTTKNHGTGLGMAIAHRIVDAHGGALEVGPGPGAEIVVILPRGT